MRLEGELHSIEGVARHNFNFLWEWCPMEMILTKELVSKQNLFTPDSKKLENGHIYVSQ